MADPVGAGVPKTLDASLFPTSTRVNPQITIMALATRIAAGMTAH